jgi:hypothetical protein
MPYNLATAAVACGINKSTVLRAIKAGRLSATRSEAGEWSIEVAELHRVFAPLPTPATTEQPAPPRGATTDDLVQLLRDQLADMRAQLSDLRQDRDHWREAFQAAQRQLPPPEQQQATATPSLGQPTGWRRTWRWLRTTG